MDYSTLSETLTVRKDVHTSSSVTGIIKDDKDLEKAYDELWKQIQEIQSKLQPGEELRIGETKIDSTTKKGRYHQVFHQGHLARKHEQG